MLLMRGTCLGGKRDAESAPLACLRLKFHHRVAFKWVGQVIKVDKMLLPSAQRLFGCHDCCRDFRRGTDHSGVSSFDVDLVSAPPRVPIHYLGIKYAFKLAPDFNRSQTERNRFLFSDKHFQEAADEETGMMKFRSN